MTPQLVNAEYIADYRIRVTFEDGVSGEIDLSDELWGPVFAPLKDQDRFRAFRLNEELNTICWDTGADLAPEYLYEHAAAGSSAAAES